MQFHFQEISTLPPLAWCARVQRGSDTVTVLHGRFVETNPRAFVEGAWNGAFARFDFDTASVVAGTGAIATPDHVRFVSSTDHLGPLFSIRGADTTYVSNSPTFVLTLSGESPDDAYPFYSDDFIGIYRQGMFCPDGRLRLQSPASLGVHSMTLITVGADGRMTFEPHRLCDVPGDFESYRQLLLDGTSEILQNAADPARTRRYAPLVPLSRGYDSTAVAALARAAGCEEAFTFFDPRKRDPKLDSGATNARFFLKMDCAMYSRWKYLEVDPPAEPEFCYSTVDAKVPLVAVEGELAGRLLLLGEGGGTVWIPRAIAASNQMSRSWATYSLGFSPIEFRLRVGYLSFAPPTIGARHNEAIHAISVSEDMSPWSIGGDYDRPLPRRIAEEAGVPRDRFGNVKGASSHSNLTRPDRFSVRGLNDYRRFVDERHARIPAQVRDEWRARVEVRHAQWDTRAKDRQYVPSTDEQRRLSPELAPRTVRVPWEYAFLFQWAVATTRDRYDVRAARSIPVEPTLQ